MRRQIAKVLSFGLLTFSLVLGIPAAVFALDAADLPAAIENATTAADHEAIAAYYDAEAKSARANADRHRAMGAAYKKVRKGPSGKGTPLPAYRTMPRHCDDQIKNFEAAAHEFEKMAAAHRKAASEIK